MRGFVIQFISLLDLTKKVPSNFNLESTYLNENIYYLIYDFMKSKISLLIISASVVGIPCGNPG